VNGVPLSGLQDVIPFFTEDAQWAQARSAVTVLKLADNLEQYELTASDMANVVKPALNRWGIKFALETFPLPNDCSTMAYDVTGALAVLDALAGWGVGVDYMTPSGGDNGIHVAIKTCGWSVQQAVQMFVVYENGIHARPEYANIKIGEIFPVGNTLGFSASEAIAIWDEYKTQTGHEMSVAHLEPQYFASTAFDYTILATLQQQANARGIEFGILHHGAVNDLPLPVSNQEWRDRVMQTAAAMDAIGVEANHNVIGSWLNKPDLALPETQPFVLTNVVKEWADTYGVGTPPPPAVPALSIFSALSLMVLLAASGMVYLRRTAKTCG